MGDFNTKKLQMKVDERKRVIEENLKNIFNKFSQTNKLIFSKLKDTVNNEENQLLGSLDELKNRIQLYLGEEMLLNEGMNHYPVSKVNFRKE